MRQFSSSISTKTLLLIIWRVCNVLMSLFFGLATYVQINDPDAALWMVGYGVPALLCALIGLKHQVTETLPWRRVADLHMTMCGGFLVMMAWKLSKENPADVFQQEEGREMSGLMLTVMWLLLCRHSGRSTVGKLRVSAGVLITIFPFVCWYHVHHNNRSSWPSHCTTAI
ncbi:transmembrane protein 220 [Nerophis ophidion]|uniref:transmembrane protein 220 n=1 Tax=Nerophis ophidion TaxID=159077 RepID=UPI002AE00602|nr:transmembrane protein 220 [Nerophis ophidion]